MKTTAFEDYEGSAHLAKGKSQSGNVQVVFVFKCANGEVLGCLHGWVNVGPASGTCRRQIRLNVRRHFLKLEDLKDEMT